MMKPSHARLPRRAPFFRSLLVPAAALLISNLACAQNDQYPLAPESLHMEGVPGHDGGQYTFTSSKIYPGTTRSYWLSIPAAYRPDQPACVMIDFDGVQFRADTVEDNLLQKKEVPVVIGVFVQSGSILQDPANPKSKTVRNNRSYEFDSTNGDLARFLLEELLPDVETRKTHDGRPIHLSHNGNDRMVMGLSSGGIAAFNLAWEHPDQFSRVYATIPTFVGMRGGDEFATLIRKTEPKPLRIFIQDNDKDSWNPIFGSWFAHSQEVESALTFAGYEVNHAWGNGGHDGNQATSIFPAVMRWLWKDYPNPPKKGVSSSDLFKAILVPGEDWQPVGNAPAPATGLSVDPQGKVAISSGREVSKFNGGEMTNFAHFLPVNSSRVFGPDGRFYVGDRDNRKIEALSPDGHSASVFNGLAAQGMLVGQNNNLYITDTLPNGTSSLWLVRPDGSKAQLDAGLSFATGLAMNPSHTLLYVAEAHTRWITSYLINPDGTLQDKERYFWLHTTERSNEAGDYSDATDFQVDEKGNLYVATNSGVQIADSEGRTRGILSLPSGAVTSLTFGGPKFDTLYIISGGKVYSRKMLLPSVQSWMPPGRL